MPTSKFSPAFESALRDRPQAEVAAIVRCDRLDPDHVAEAESLGLTVSRQLRLIRGLAVAGPAAALLELAAAPWALSIEPDQPVHTTAEVQP